MIIGCLAALVLLASMVLIGILFSRYIRSRQVEQQVELARTVQTGLLPSAQTRPPSADGIDFGAVFVPAATVGGDFAQVEVGIPKIGLAYLDRHFTTHTSLPETSTSAQLVHSLASTRP